MGHSHRGHLCKFENICLITGIFENEDPPNHGYQLVFEILILTNNLWEKDSFLGGILGSYRISFGKAIPLYAEG